MKLSNCIKYFFFIIFFCLFSLNTNAFPKKKHSIIKDKIIKRDYENVFELGYIYGYLEYCSFARTEDKETYKRVKGLVAYTNWDLFLVFNRGIQDLSATLRAAGIGWAGGSYYIANNYQHDNVPYKYGLKSCGSTESMSKGYRDMDRLIENVIINFLLQRDNFDSNLSEIINALAKDKRDDYSGIISRLKNASNPDNIEALSSSEETVSKQDNNSQDSSDDIRTQLKKLKALFEDDLITEDEYNEKKKELLDKM